MSRHIFLAIILLINSLVAGEEMYYYAGSTKIYLYPHNERISITWQKDLTTDDKENILQSNPEIKSWYPAIGVRTGVNYNILHYPSENRKLSGLGYNIGLEFECDFGEVVGCNVVCSFLQNKYTYKIPSAWSDESTYVFNNLYLPIEIDFVLKRLTWVQLSLKIGAAGVFQLSGRITGWVEPHTIDTEIVNLSNKFCFRWGVGLPVRFTSKLKLSPCFYYQHTLANDNSYFPRPHRFYDFLFNVGFLYILDNNHFKRHRRNNA
ncbi:MAG: outer membrane beta-barrel protein [bacterium]